MFKDYYAETRSRKFPPLLPWSIHTLCLEQIYEILLHPLYILTRAGHISVVETDEACTINKIYNIEKIPHGQRFLAGQLTIVRGSQKDIALNNHGEMYVFNFCGNVTDR